MVRSASAAARPALLVGRPKAEERKKFCMSIMIRAVLVGLMRIGCVVVFKIRAVGSEVESSRVRSMRPVAGL